MGVVGDVSGAHDAQGVNEVSGVGGSGAGGGKVRSNGPGPIWALGFGVEDGGGRFERVRTRVSRSARRQSGGGGGAEGEGSRWYRREEVMSLSSWA